MIVRVPVMKQKKKNKNKNDNIHLSFPKHTKKYTKIKKKNQQKIQPNLLHNYACALTSKAKIKAKKFILFDFPTSPIATNNLVARNI